jgi:hypothetical protein
MCPDCAASGRCRLPFFRFPRGRYHSSSASVDLCLFGLTLIMHLIGCVINLHPEIRRQKHNK